MRSLLFISGLLFFSTISAQHWATIPGTNIEFSNYGGANQNDRLSSRYEYFRKNRLLIGVIKNLSAEFYTMLREAPDAFESIFLHTRLITTKELDNRSRRYDSSILTISYDSAVIFDYRDIIKNGNKVTWRLTNYSWSYFNFNACHTEICFRYKKRPNKRRNSLIFLLVNPWDCDL